MNISKVFTIAFLVSLLVFIITGFLKDPFPKLNNIKKDLLKEPVQLESTKEKFNVEKKGVIYTIDPLFEYELRGLVVSEHDAKQAFDYYHNEWKDYINIKDLCVIWGSNVEDDNYKDFKYKNGSFTCYVETKSDEALKEFDFDKLSNNHLLTIDDELSKKIRSVKRGDQIYLKGYLASYATDDGFTRGTSTSRTDRGGNACETVFITDFKVLESSMPQLDSLHNISKYIALVLLFLTILFFFVQPFEHHKKIPDEPEEPKGYRGWTPTSTDS